MPKPKDITATKLRTAVERIRELCANHSVELAIVQAEAAGRQHADAVRQGTYTEARLEKLEATGGAVSLKYQQPEKDAERLKHAREAVGSARLSFESAQRQVVVTRLRLAELFLRLAAEPAFRNLFLQWQPAPDGDESEAVNE